MGVHSRYAAALLIFVLVPGIVQGAVRQALKPPAKQIVTESTAGVSFPNSQRHYYGNDRYYSLDYSVNASSSDKIPTVRAVKPSTVGTPSFPYGGTPFYPDTPNQVLKVKPKAVVPKAPLITKFKNALKFNPASLAFSVGTSAAVAAVGWGIDEVTKQPTKEQTVHAPFNESFIHWYTADQSKAGLGTSPVDACRNLADQLPNDVFEAIGTGTGGQPTCRLRDTRFGNIRNNSMQKRGTECPANYSYDVISLSCSQTAYLPMTHEGIDATSFADINDEWLDDILRDTCNGSPSPDACYEEMRSNSPLEGPAVVQGPTSTTSQTKINPDGSTETTTTTTSTEHPITYGDGFFDVGTRTTTTSEVNGIPTGTTVTEDTTTPAPIAPDAPPQESEPEYTFEDSEFPPVEPFYEAKYPDGLSSVWSAAYVSVGQTAFIEFLNGFVPNFSGSCPSFGMSFAIASWANFGSIDFMNLCYVLEFVKMILLVTALFTSRAIIFGG